MFLYGVRIMKKSILLLFSMISITACQTAPETGRSQLLLISASDEVTLGYKEFTQLKRNVPVSRDHKMTAVLNKVGRRLAHVAKLKGAKWEFILFDQPQTVNAFCLPGGKVGVYSGMLPVAMNEAGLATVLAHEIAHADARHGAERVSIGLLTKLTGEVINITARNQTPAVRELINSSYNIGSAVGVVLPHSREQELEADHIGLLYMARAGYPPDEAINFWQRFAQHINKNNKTPKNDFFSTHPISSERIKRLRELLPLARQEYKKSLLRKN